MRILAAALVVIFLFAACALTPQQATAPVVKLEDDNGYGSGVPIAPGFILTAAHVVERKAVVVI